MLVRVLARDTVLMTHCSRRVAHSPAQFSLESVEEGPNADAEKVAQYYYITFITLASFDKTGRLNRKCRPDYIWDLANLQQKVGVIEISRKGLLEKAYFIVPSVCTYLTPQSKDLLVQQALKVHKVDKVIQALQVLKDLQDRKETRVIRVM